MRHTPVSSSPASSARSTGAAPRHRGQQREVEVDHRQTLRARALDQLAERHHHAEVGAGGQHVVDPVGHRAARVRRQPPSPGSAAARSPALAACPLCVTTSATSNPRCTRARAAAPRWPACRGTRAGGDGPAPGPAPRSADGRGHQVRRRRRFGRSGSGGSVWRRRHSLRASLRWSAVMRSNMSTPLRWSSSCWKSRASELVGLERDLVAVEVPAVEQDLLRPGDLDVEARDRQAPLVVHPLAARLLDGRVDERVRTLADVVDEQLLLHADLRRGQAEPGRGRTSARASGRPA